MQPGCSTYGTGFEIKFISTKL